jgi:hypothetical protein
LNIATQINPVGRNFSQFFVAKQEKTIVEVLQQPNDAPNGDLSHSFNYKQFQSALETGIF